jgi:hypothetical protein
MKGGAKENLAGSSDERVDAVRACRALLETMGRFTCPQATFRASRGFLGEISDEISHVREMEIRATD